MLFFREWAHYLYPQNKFSDFTTRVRKECSSRIMKDYLNTLRRGGNEFAEVDAALDLDAVYALVDSRTEQILKNPATKNKISTNV